MICFHIWQKLSKLTVYQPIFSEIVYSGYCDIHYLFPTTLQRNTSCRIMQWKNDEISSHLCQFSFNFTYQTFVLSTHVSTSVDCSLTNFSHGNSSDTRACSSTSSRSLQTFNYKNSLHILNSFYRFSIWNIITLCIFPEWPT